VSETPFEVALPGGVLHGHVGGEGPPALLLHGGAAVTDYMDGCARELDGVFRTMRYQQRGTYPSDADPPYSIEAHIADAVRVLDHFGIDRAWVVGHSWGGHLALHLAVSHAERLLGVVCVAPLGAFDDVFAEHDANLRRGLSDAEIARVEAVERRRREGVVTDAELVERMSILWPRWFADPENAAPCPITHVGARCSTEVNVSLSHHFAARTLERELLELRLPALFVHGDRDALPLRSSTATAALIPGAVVVTLPGSGHFPWLERPGELRRAVESFLAKP
jgi:pimeloyl-ACP methyl ester carboxylesterase